jgi:hypothetical protein
MDQWQRQCPSKEHRLRGHWPGGLEDGPQDGVEEAHDVSVTEGLIVPGPKGPLCHHVERLVHLELADLVVNRQYLDSNFTLARGPNTPSRPKIAPSSSAGKKNFPRHQCSDCTCPFQVLLCPLIDLSRRHGAPGNIHDKTSGRRKIQGQRMG